MNLRNISILCLSLALSFGASAQLDSRNRTPETVITDGLAQLPAKTTDKYNEVIAEMAATGQRCIEMISAMLSPEAGAQNSTFEYAIDAITSYATKTDDKALRKSIHDGLVNGFKASKGDANRAFLLSQLNKIACGKCDGKMYADLLADPYLRQTAIAGLASMPNADDAVIEIIADSEPDGDLAYLAYNRKIKDVGPVLDRWAKLELDPKTAEQVYAALAVCAPDLAIKTLGAKAKAAKYANIPNGVTEAYLLSLLASDDDKTVIAKAKELTKATPHVRCAGLSMLLQRDKANFNKNVVAALNDKDAAYRHTALLNAQVLGDDDIYDVVAAKFDKLSPNAKVDVLRWLGNNHAASQIDLICPQVALPDSALAIAAIEAASKIGGEKALNALIERLKVKGNPFVHTAAANGLLTFNGDIKPGILPLLDSNDYYTSLFAYSIASARKIYEAYDKAIERAASDNEQLKNVALNNLKNFARPQNFDELCSLITKASSDDDAKNYAWAAGKAISSLSPEKRYLATSYHLGKGDGSKDKYYYVMLANTDTDEAVDYLYNAYKEGRDADQALEAMLTLNNGRMIDILYDLAKSGSDKQDRILLAYLRQIGNDWSNGYRLFNNALAINPSDWSKNLFLRNLDKYPIEPSLVLAARYLDNEATAFLAASAIRNILSKNPALQRGTTNKHIAEKAREVLLAEKAKGDADAGYAADELTGILANLPTDYGYEVVVADQASAGMKLDGNYENFEMYFDWNSAVPATVVLRGMPLLTLEADGNVKLNGSDKPGVAAARGNNNVYVRLVNDRIFVQVNGVPVASNDIIVNPTLVKGKAQAAPTSGVVAIECAEPAVSNVYFNHLPDTPVFTLSPEEEAEGFEILFDGRSLDKWHGNTAAYVPVDGNIYVTAEYGGSGNLYTKKNYSDFIYRFDFCFDVPGVNNGIGIRTGRDVTGVDAAFWGMEIQVLDHDDPIYQGHNFGYTGIQPYQNHGCVYGVVAAKHFPSGPIKKWHTEEIKAIGDQITVTVDGEVILDANIREACQGHEVAPDGSNVNPYMIDHRNHPGLFNKEGYISFCGHGQGVMFRNVRILDLSKEAVKARKKAAKK